MNGVMSEQVDDKKHGREYVGPFDQLKKAPLPTQKAIIQQRRQAA